MSIRSIELKIVAFAAIGTVGLFAAGCGSSGNSTAETRNAAGNGAENRMADAHSEHGTEGEFKIPPVLAAEHKELHEELEAAINSGGETGAAARTVEERLSVHFKKEEEFALPQLGLLADIAQGKTSPEMKRAIEMADKLKADMPQMLSEHKGILQALDALAAAAKTENKAEAAAFVENLKAHAQNEEQITYPAAILVGEYLKLKLGSP